MINAAVFHTKAFLSVRGQSGPKRGGAVSDMFVLLYLHLGAHMGTDVSHV